MTMSQQDTNQQPRGLLRIYLHLVLNLKDPETKIMLANDKSEPITTYFLYHDCNKISFPQKMFNRIM